jgi:hypothetical protein
MKSNVYRRIVDTRDELLYHKMDVIVRIKERVDALRRETRHNLTRIAKCIDVDCGILKMYYARYTVLTLSLKQYIPVLETVSNICFLSTILELHSEIALHRK